MDTKDSTRIGQTVKRWERQCATLACKLLANDPRLLRADAARQARTQLADRPGSPSWEREAKRAAERDEHRRLYRSAKR